MKVAVLGLDCAAPHLVFDQWREELPNLRQLMDAGRYGPLESTHPPITVPAWACMMSSRDPGQFGIYGFRNRKDHSYDGYALANASTCSAMRTSGQASWGASRSEAPAVGLPRGDVAAGPRRPAPG